MSSSKPTNTREGFNPSANQFLKLTADPFIPYDPQQSSGTGSASGAGHPHLKGFIMSVMLVRQPLPTFIPPIVPFSFLPFLISFVVSGITSLEVVIMIVIAIVNVWGAYDE
ncbi:hypothetical protein QBC38DRAFT_459991 [Podospora fimiseda]|uniref:Uncharacterized protein n=1 Tax=Podospora fimiseda TaxID=252190 RepID=A0AAN7BEI0_9PEZI|nr:hypothetical protein QBC38DRAFT_459991 [Podospora fimiseda]